MTNSRYKLAATSFLLVAGTLLPTAARAQSTDQEQTARRQAILQQDQFITEDGEIVDQDAIVLPPPQATFRETQSSTPVQQVRWRGRYYGGPAGYYGAPRAQYYARYPSYYDPYSRAYGYGGYRNYYTPGYGYRGYSGYGYRDYGYRYPNGAARVGPLRFYW